LDYKVVFLLNSLPSLATDGNFPWTLQSCQQAALHFMPERRLQTHLFFEALLGAANATHSSWLTKVRYTSVLHFQRTGYSNDTGGDPAEA
jgi:hypothetical protein